MDCSAIKVVLLLSLLSVLNVESIVDVVRLTFNSNYQYGNLSIVSRKDDQGVQVFNVTFKYVYDVLQLKLLVVIKMSNDNSSTYDNEIFKTSIDLCKVSDGVLGTFAMRWFMESFNNTANFIYKCPFYKDKDYSITNYKLSESNLPVPKNLNCELTCKYMGKIPKKKMLVHLYTWRSNFIIRN